MATTRRAKRKHVLQGLGLAAQTVFATPSLLIDPSFSSRLGSFLAGPKQTAEVDEPERPETLTEALLRKKRLLRLSQARRTGTAPDRGVLMPNVAQANQGSAGGAGSLLGGLANPTSPFSPSAGATRPATGLFGEAGRG